MKKLYPMLFEPIFKNYIWGGRNLAAFGKDLPADDVVAESWEISSHEDGTTKVKNGLFAGELLSDVFKTLGSDLVGTNNQWALERGKFPLLVKLLDANKSLSVQVHPDDAYAQMHEGNELGKTEMWVVLRVEPDAGIIYGLERETTPNEIRDALSNGNLEGLLHRISIQTGDHVCVPAGTIHAILGGAVVAEIQQNSNTTYRVFDWNRKDSNGKSRPLHINKALDVINYQQIKLGLPMPEVIEDHHEWRWERLYENQYFTTERIIAKKDTRYCGNCDGKTLEIWGVISGSALINNERLEAVQFCLLPAAMGLFEIDLPADTVVLRTYVS